MGLFPFKCSCKLMLSLSLINYFGIIILQLQRKVISAVFNFVFYPVTDLVNGEFHKLSYQRHDLRTNERDLGKERAQYLLIHYLKPLVSALAVRELKEGKIPLSLVHHDSIP